LFDSRCRCLSAYPSTCPNIGAHLEDRKWNEAENSCNQLHYARNHVHQVPQQMARSTNSAVGTHRRICWQNKQQLFSREFENIPDTSCTTVRKWYLFTINQISAPSVILLRQKSHNHFSHRSKLIYIKHLMLRNLRTSSLISFNS
jgi:hypothetical protein